MHSMQYAFRDRRARKGDFRKLWIQRINAWLPGSMWISYSRPINGLHLAGVEVDRKVPGRPKLDRARGLRLVGAGGPGRPPGEGAARPRWPRSLPGATPWPSRTSGSAGCAGWCEVVQSLERRCLRGRRARAVAHRAGSLVGRWSPSICAPEGARDPDVQAACQQAAQDAGARLFALAPGVLELVANTVTPQPVLAVLPLGAHDEATVLGPPASGDLLVVMVDVRDPGNAGTVVRTADASGVRGVIFAGDSVDPYNPKTVRASAGSLFHLPFVVQPDAAALATSLTQAAFPTLATGAEAARGLRQRGLDRAQRGCSGGQRGGRTRPRRAGPPAPSCRGHPHGGPGRVSSMSAWPAPWSASRHCVSAASASPPREGTDEGRAAQGNGAPPVGIYHLRTWWDPATGDRPIII